MENSQTRPSVKDPGPSSGSSLAADLAKYQGSYNEGKQPFAFTAQKERREASLFQQHLDGASESLSE